MLVSVKSLGNDYVQWLKQEHLLYYISWGLKLPHSMSFLEWIAHVFNCPKVMATQK